MIAPASFMTYGAAAAIAVLIAAVGYSQVQLAGARTARADERAAHAKTREEFANEATKAADILAAKTAGARRTEQALQADADKARKETHEAVSDSTRLRDALRAERLRGAAEARRATAAMPGAASDSRPRGAAERDDATELPGEAGAAEEEDEALRADTIRLHLLQCYRVVRSARAARQEQ